jgi:8-oxo-dGTP pyrophosphatase MutT (NUDIX family)
MTFHDFTVKLREELMNPLPGRDVQLKMSSNRRIRELLDFSGMDNAVKSSVLILFYPAPSDGTATFVLTLRPEYGGVHSGQISLPGGKYKESDGDLSETALRETKEEIGIDVQKIDLLGKLSELYIPPSNFLVQPFIGAVSPAQKFFPDPEEVSKIIEIRLPDLLNQNNIKKRHVVLSNGANVFAPCYIINGDLIWGATAMILSELREIAKKISG